MAVAFRREYSSDSVVCLRRLPKEERDALARNPRAIRKIAESIATLELAGEVKIVLNSRSRDRFAGKIAAFGPGAWEALKPVLEGTMGSALGEAQVIEHRDVARISRVLGGPTDNEPEDVVAELLSPKPQEIKLQALFARAARAKDNLLIFGKIPIQRPKRASAVQPSEKEESAEERDARLVSALRRRRLADGLLDSRAAEREAVFWDLNDILFDQGGKLQPRCTFRRGLVRDLFLLLLWATSNPERSGTQQLAALLLGEMAAAVGRGGTGARATQGVLATEVEALGLQFLETFRAVDTSSRKALALVAARVGIARATVLAGLDGDTRRIVRSAYSSEASAYEGAIESIRKAILDT